MSSSTNEISLERIANSKQTTAGEMITTNIRLQSDARDPPDQLKNSRNTSEKREGLLVSDPLKEYSCTRVNEQATIATSFLNDEKESRGKRAEPSPRLSDSCRRESESQDPSECSRVHSTLTHSVVKTPSFENRVESEKIKCDGSSNVQKRVEEPRRKKKRHFLHRFKKKKQKEKKVEWQGSIQIIPILQVLDSDDDKDPHVASER